MIKINATVYILIRVRAEIDHLSSKTSACCQPSKIFWRIHNRKQRIIIFKSLNHRVYNSSEIRSKISHHKYFIVKNVIPLVLRRKSNMRRTPSFEADAKMSPIASSKGNAIEVAID